jgi:hypothetical protein
LKIFLGGIMQGSRTDSGIHGQGYRDTIRSELRARYPDVDVVCPFEQHPNSVAYGEEMGRQMLLNEAVAAAAADALIAYVPEASMGTAIEMWQACQAGKPIWTISPLSANWVVRFLSTEVFPDLDGFVQFLRSGGMDGLQQRG